MSPLSLNLIDIKNALSDHAAYYPYKVKDELFMAYAKRLNKYPATIVEVALEHISENAGRAFPTIQDIKSTCELYVKDKRKRGEL